MSALWSLWWVWMAAGLILAIAEILAPGFIFLGFAIGAAGVGVLLLLGVSAGPAPLLLIFAVLSLLAWLALRRVFALPKGQVKRVHHDIND
ncbi:MAG: hypothetical protein OIF47_15005 [Marinibacterium sp.]|nr:hypothetical protein [Marinibacterium sp.]